MTTNQAFVQFTYPADAASDFDLDYYLDVHVSLLRQRWEPHGLCQCIVSVGEKGEAYYVQATLIWDSLESFKNAGYMDEIMGDIRNFTSSTPSRTIATVVRSVSRPA
jgi:uncharacterized protein (TIGR02118 family)